MLLIGLSLTVVGTSHRPAWWAFGIALLCALVWQGWRHDLKAARWAALGMGVGPLGLTLAFNFGHLDWGWQQDTARVFTCGALGVISFLALRRDAARLSALLSVWYLLLASPIDVAYQPNAGGPLVQPLKMGLLRPGLTPEQAMQFVEGGCIVGGLEPRWVLTWQ